MDKQIITTTMQMPPFQRVALAELLLASLDYEAEDIQTEWINEVHARMNAVNEGRSKLLDFDLLWQ
jgi:putative addiction module component (TIGR02574 family)